MRNSLRLALGVWLIATLYPMVWLAYTSLKPSRDIFLSPFSLPSQVVWDNYLRAWTVGQFGSYFLNSLLVTVASVILTVGLGACSAFALARFNFPGRGVVLYLFLAGLMVPLQLAVIPLFFWLKTLHLLNSLAGLTLVYVATGLPFAVFILTGFFRSLPQELYESALLDGCDPWKAFTDIMLPLARPGLITVAVFTFLGVWNEYFLAFMFLSGQGAEALKTLPLGLANLTIVSQYRTDYGMVFAGIMIVMIPTLIVYVWLQKYLKRGITTGAIKG